MCLWCQYSDCSDNSTSPMPGISGHRGPWAHATAPVASPSVWLLAWIKLEQLMSRWNGLGARGQWVCMGQLWGPGESWPTLGPCENAHGSETVCTAVGLLPHELISAGTEIGKSGIQRSYRADSVWAHLLQKSPLHLFIHPCVIFLFSQRAEQDKTVIAHTKAQTTSHASACWSRSGTGIYLDNQHCIFFSNKLTPVTCSSLKKHICKPVPNHNDWRGCPRKVM